MSLTFIEKKNEIEHTECKPVNVNLVHVNDIKSPAVCVKMVCLCIHMDIVPEINIKS